MRFQRQSINRYEKLTEQIKNGKNKKIYILIFVDIKHKRKVASKHYVRTNDYSLGKHKVTFDISSIIQELCWIHSRAEIIPAISVTII